MRAGARDGKARMGWAVRQRAVRRRRVDMVRVRDMKVGRMDLTDQALRHGFIPILELSVNG